jgi:hypothetical protein
MFDTWRLDRKLAKMQRFWADELDRFKVDAAKRAEELADPQAAIIESVDEEVISEMTEALRQHDLVANIRLTRQAGVWDVEMPRGQPEFWTEDTVLKTALLNSKGRTYVRKLIDEERGRRFEVKTRWVTKLILPLLAGLIGVIGAVTGLVAVLRHK